VGDVAPEDTIHALARAKMSAVLGPQRAEQLLEQLLREHGLVLQTANDLHRFAAQLAKMDGFEGAVGAMLGVQAVMRGSDLRPPSSPRDASPHGEGI
jgi:hypothetical protein